MTWSSSAAAWWDARPPSHLARAGASVLLVERRGINAGASGQNAGSLHFQLERRLIEQGEAQTALAAKMMQLNVASIRDWVGLEVYTYIYFGSGHGRRPDGRRDGRADGAPGAQGLLRIPGRPCGSSCSTGRRCAPARPTCRRR
ncbi:MAG: FAD-dependent oxidoreductase [Caulobacteraceae bacterium]